MAPEQSLLCKKAWLLSKQYTTKATPTQAPTARGVPAN